MQLTLLSIETYNPSKNYKVGDIVKYNDIDYQCIVDNTTGAFDVNKWLVFNSIDVLVDDPIVSNFNEELDSATALIENQTYPIHFEILDEVLLEGDGKQFYFCISDYEETMVNPANPHYDYKLSLVSQVKELEGIILPNLNITKTARKRSVYWYIDEYLKLYGAKKRVSGNLVDKWDWYGIINKFNTTDCPEMQWNRPTLREVLNDLMMVCDCIPTLKNGVIGFLDLAQRVTSKIVNGESVPVIPTNINYINKSKSLSDYATGIEMELQNVLQDKDNTAYGLTNMVEYISFRDEGLYVLNTKNAFIYTRNPIYRIKHFYLCAGIEGFYNSSSIGTKYVECDLCNLPLNGGKVSLIKEEKEYKVLPVAYKSKEIRDIEALVSCQNFCLWYSRGSNKINGWSDETKLFWFIQESTMEKIINVIGGIFFQNSGVGYDYKPYDYLTGISFKIEYECLANTKFQADKYLPSKNERVIIDNQTNSMVNADRQGFLEYMKANRLGNEMLVLSARYDSLSDNGLVDVGAVYGDDYIIFKRDIKINPNYIQVVYYATKHYILKDYYTGVKAKIRSWKIDDEGVLVRNELHKYYYEFSFENSSINDYAPVPANVLLSSFKTHYDFEIIKNCLIRTTANNSLTGSPSYSYYPTDAGEGFSIFQYIINELDSKVIGNSIVFKTQMLDNYNSGVVVLDEEHIWMNPFYETGRPLEKDAKYVGSYGELVSADFIVADSQCIDKSEGDFEWPEYIDNAYGSWADVSSTTCANIQAKSTQKPLAKSTFITGTVGTDYYKEIFNFNKDQREIMALTLQLEYCSDTPDIVFGSQFIYDNNLVSTNYRTLYQPIDDVTIEGELLALDTLVERIGDIVQASEDNVGLFVIVNDYTAQIDYDFHYYQSTKETAFGNLYDLRIDRSYDSISQDTTFINALRNKYVIASSPTYSYPSGLNTGDIHKKLYATNVYEGTYQLNSAVPANLATNKYMVAWIYDNYRDLIDARIIDYRNVYSTLPTASEVGKYRVTYYDNPIYPSNYTTVYDTTNYYLSNGLPSSVPPGHIGEYIAVFNDRGSVYPWVEYPEVGGIRYTLKVTSGVSSAAKCIVQYYMGSSLISRTLYADESLYLSQVYVPTIASIVFYNTGNMPITETLKIEVMLDTTTPIGTQYYEPYYCTEFNLNPGQSDYAANVGGDTHNSDILEYEIKRPGDGKWWFYAWDGSQWLQGMRANDGDICRHQSSNSYYYWHDYGYTTYTPATNRTYQLFYAQSTSAWQITDPYAADSTHVYKNSVGLYYQWTGTSWTSTINSSINKSYYNYLSNGSTWTKGTAAVNNEFYYIGNNEYNNSSTAWYKWNSTTFDSVGNTIVTYDSHLFTTTDGVNLLQVDSDLDEVFNYEGDNYIWDTDPNNPSSMNWLLHNVYYWDLKGDPDGKKFSYNNLYYEWSTANKQLYYINTLEPVTNILRTDPNNLGLESQYKLKMYYANEKVKIYDMNHLPDTRYLCSNWSLAINDNEISINLGSVSDANAYYITDAQNNVLLAFNRHTTTGVEHIYLNALKSRKK